MEYTLLITTCTNKSRELRYLINEILKKGLAVSIKRLNYVKSYTWEDGKIKKADEKILIIKLSPEKKENLIKLMLSKKLEIEILNPENI